MNLISKFQELKQKLLTGSSINEFDNGIVNDFEIFENLLSDRLNRMEGDYRKYKMLFQNAGDSIFIQDENGKIISSNLTASIQYQYTESEMLNLNIPDIDVSEQHVNIEERINLLMRQGYINFESVHKRKDGSIFPVDVSARRIVWSGKNAILSICRDISERKRTELALKESEARLRQITANMTDVVWIADLNLNTTYVSPSIYKLVGFTPEEQLEKKPEERIPIESLIKVKNALEAELSKENDSNVDKERTGIFEIEQYKADGTIIPLAINIKFIRDENGKPVGLQGVSRDISEIKKAEKILIQTSNDNAFLTKLSFSLADSVGKDPIKDIALPQIKNYTNASYAQFTVFNDTNRALVVNHIEADSKIIRDISDAAGDGIFSTITKINKNFHNQLLKNDINLFSSLTELSFGSIPKKIDSAIREATGLQNFFAIPQINSGVVYGATLLAFKQNQLLPSADLLKSFSNILAVSLRNKIAEDEIFEREIQLRSIANNLGNSMIYQVIAIDQNKRKFTYVSDNVHKLYGCSAKDVKADPNLIYSRIHKDDIAELQKKEMVCISTMSEFKSVVRVINPDNTIRWSYFVSKPRYYKGQICWDGIEFDITDQKLIENQLRERNQEKDLFMRLLAHDLRGPFSAILGYSNLLVKNFDKYSNQKIGEQLAITNKVLHKTYNLLDNMLLWAKSQSGILPYEPRMVIAEDMCVEVVSFLKESANNKKIDIFLTDTSRTNIFADPDLLQIVLRNLLSNAIKFTHNGGEIYISINQKDNFAEISFLDNGIGICPKNLNNLWNPSSFFTTLGTDKEMGTGLGLLLCKEFVVKNGGQIRVESQENKGSNFIFTVPLQGK